MYAVEVNHIVKTFADNVAVDDLSFTVSPGEIVGLIGPNGAGKTTTIRMMMDIIKPDSGEISILGEKLSEAAKDKIGYLPEERGLYKKLKILDSINYLASLKGMSKSASTERATELLARTGLEANKNKKIEEMSRGMSQIIQFIVTIVHDPQLVVLDEPFAGLDPVNTELLRGMFFDLRDQGKAVILSAHEMHQVEELCDRILMINRGRAVLYGDLAEIKSRYKGDAVLLEYEGELGELPGVAETRQQKGYVELKLDGKTDPQKLLEQLLKKNLKINRFEMVTPSLHEIFLKEVGKTGE